MEIISRAGWGARSPKPGTDITAWAYRSAFMVHHSGGPADQTVRQIQNWCMDDRGFKDIDYNFLIDQYGRAYTGRGWSIVGSHCVDWNTRAIGVCVIGNDQLSASAAAALRDLYDEACQRAGKRLTPMVHSDQAQTACPGSVIRQWVHRGGLEAPVRDVQLTQPEMHGLDVKAVQRIVGAQPDGVFGPETDAKVRRWQSAHHLVVDGIVGPLTRKAMHI